MARFFVTPIAAAQAAFEFSYQPTGQLAQTGTQTAILSKTTTPANDTNPQGSWTGATDGHSASFLGHSINSRDAQVKYNFDGNNGQGVGDRTA
jgi:hypothetical protein